MIQTPLQLPDTLGIRVPLPAPVERWRDLYLHSSVEKLVVFLIIAALFYFLARLARRAIGEHIEDINRRHILRKGVSYGASVLLVLVAIALFADWLAGFGTILALMLAGVAVALQDVLKSFVGWLYMSSRSGIEIGSRVEVGGIAGDVIDVGVLKTTMLEVGGPLVYGRQSTGRLVTVPNYRMLGDAVLIAPSSSPYVWHELRWLVTFDSDWRRAEEILREAAGEIYEEVAPELEAGFRRLEGRYAFKYGALTPIVYVSVAPYAIELVLRFLVHVRRRRGASDRATRRILGAFAAEPNIRIAVPTYHVQGGGKPGVPQLVPMDDLGVTDSREDGIMSDRQ